MANVRRTWRYGVAEHCESRNNLTGFRFRSREAAARRAEKFRQRYPGAVVCSLPPTDVEARWRELRARHEAFSVHYWWVGEDKTDAAGRKLIGWPIGQHYAYREDALRALATLRTTHPNAKLYGAELMFNPDSLEDRRRRAEFVSTLVTRS